jgi:hypothetical protein
MADRMSEEMGGISLAAPAAGKKVSLAPGPGFGGIVLGTQIILIILYASCVASEFVRRPPAVKVHTCLLRWLSAGCRHQCARTWRIKRMWP